MNVALCFLIHLLCVFDGLKAQGEKSLKNWANENLSSVFRGVLWFFLLHVLVVGTHGRYQVMATAHCVSHGCAWPELFGCLRKQDKQRYVFFVGVFLFCLRGGLERRFFGQAVWMKGCGLSFAVVKSHRTFTNRATKPK
jgi:hypothetical protein